MLFLSFFLFSQWAFCDHYLLTTKKPLKAEQTFSDLKVLPRLHPTTNFKLWFQFKLIQQNRFPAPNPWESFWIFWSYNKNLETKKRTNYLAFKTNGLEIGQAFDEVQQTFIWTDESFKISPMKWYTVILSFSNSKLTISVEGNEFIIPENVLAKTYQNPGRIGLYSEDATVEIKDVGLDIF